MDEFINCSFHRHRYYYYYYYYYHYYYHYYYYHHHHHHSSYYTPPCPSNTPKSEEVSSPFNSGTAKWASSILLLQP